MNIKRGEIKIARDLQNLRFYKLENIASAKSAVLKVFIKYPNLLNLQTKTELAHEPKLHLQVTEFV